MTVADPVVVVGAGLAGVTCAREVAAAGIPVRVVDRGLGIGGRMASRRIDGRPVDLGASYFTVSDAEFGAVVEGWRARRLAAPWTDTFTVLDAENGASTTSGPVRWGAPGGSRSLVEDLAGDLPVRRSLVESVDLVGGALVVDGERASAVVLAMPDTQAARPLGRGLADVTARLRRRSDPVITLAGRWAARTWDEVAPEGRFEGAFVNGDDVLDWVADDGRRRGDDAPVLVAHSTVGFARAHLDTPTQAGPPMVAALRRLLGLTEPLDVHVQRWALAKPVGDRADRYLLTDDLVGVCGDGWGPTSKVETAWVSGHALGRELVARLA